MPKKVWKQIRKEYLQSLDKKSPDTQRQIVSMYGVDGYGFTQAERAFLAREGFDIRDIDWFIEEDFTPLEILKIASAGIKTNEVAQMIIEGWDTEEVMAVVTDDDSPISLRKSFEDPPEDDDVGNRLDDIPVADRKRVLQ